MDDRIFSNLPLTKFDLIKLKNARNYLIVKRPFLFFLLQCLMRKCLQLKYLRWARSALKALYNIDEHKYICR